jgi:uncharacterized protein
MAESSGPDSTVSAPPAAPPAAAYLAGNPAVYGLLIFSVGGVDLGFSLLGYVSAAGQGGSVMPLILMATGLGTLLTAIWSAAQGQTFVATVFGAFAGFWISYSALLFSAVGFYAFLSTGLESVGGKPLPLGRPVIVGS